MTRSITCPSAWARTWTSAMRSLGLSYGTVSMRIVLCYSNNAVHRANDRCKYCAHKVAGEVHKPVSPSKPGVLNLRVSWGPPVCYVRPAYIYCVRLYGEKYGSGFRKHVL